MSIPSILAGAAGRALRSLQPLTTPTKGLDALVVVQRAMPEMAAALGDDAAKALGKRLFDASRSGSTRTAASRETVRLGLQELESAARTTARKRLFIGSLGISGALAGIIAVRNAAGSGGGGDQIAPGPLPEPGAPGGGGGGSGGSWS
jgi:hypothetical protein